MLPSPRATCVLGFTLAIHSPFDGMLVAYEGAWAQACERKLGTHSCTDMSMIRFRMSFPAMCASSRRTPGFNVGWPTASRQGSLPCQFSVSARHATPSSLGAALCGVVGDCRVPDRVDAVRGLLSDTRQRSHSTKAQVLVSGASAQEKSTYCRIYGFCFSAETSHTYHVCARGMCMALHTLLHFQRHKLYKYGMRSTAAAGSPTRYVIHLPCSLLRHSVQRCSIIRCAFSKRS